MKHLKEVPIPETDSSTGENVIVEFAKKNKYFIIGNCDCISNSCRDYICCC